MYFPQALLLSLLLAAVPSLVTGGAIPASAREAAPAKITVAPKFHPPPVHTEPAHEPHRPGAHSKRVALPEETPKLKTPKAEPTPKAKNGDAKATPKLKTPKAEPTSKAKSGDAKASPKHKSARAEDPKETPEHKAPKTEEAKATLRHKTPKAELTRMAKGGDAEPTASS